MAKASDLFIEALDSEGVEYVFGIPGGLIHSNIASCAVFAACAGSSVATAATIGTVAIGQIEKHGYNERFFLGTIAAVIGILVVNP